ncbi:hypothetical protein Bca4012_071645 [Brassica carinata]|uniref:Uncharacterized protein n=1 Tax=Brassica carinata TaxID=52824 RepID=A0A8X7QFR8_BRACI|nr:hypothetical protein Bca52824_063902 [Brassica carinata]
MGTEDNIARGLQVSQAQAEEHPPAHEEDRKVVALVEWHQFLRVLLSPTVSTTHTGAARAAASSLDIYSFGCSWKRNEACSDECNFCSAESSPSKKLAPDSSDKADGSSS